MSIQLTELKPYKSFTIAHLPQRHQVRSIVNAVLDDAKAFIGLNRDDERIQTEFRSHKLDPPSGEGAVWLGYFHYLEHRAPSWYGGDGDLQDETNELFLVLQYNRHLAIYISDSRRKGSLKRRIGDGKGRGLGTLKPVSRGILNAAFVNGPTRTIWLSGIHTPVSVKADSKVLSGQNLRDALDPLDDQTFHFTAARSSVESLHLPIGVAPRTSRIWVGATFRWNEFLETSVALLRHLETTIDPVTEPLPVVAVEVTEAPQLSEAFELHFAAPELLMDSPDIDEDAKMMMERWAYRSNWEIFETDGNAVRCDVTLEDKPLGRVTIELDTSDPEHINIVAVSIDEANGADTADVEEAMQVCKRVSWLKIWFESGHTIANAAIFAIRHRDMPFNNYRWIDLADYDAKQEKFWDREFPPNASEIIDHKDSLFCWVKNEYANAAPEMNAVGWLACDDGSMELADFVYLDDSQSPPLLSMIHVKGAGSNQPDRGISVSSYEVVVGQAVKNLRHLDRINMAIGLEAGLEKRIGELVWHNGVLDTRESMLRALSQIGANFRRQVVVLQPHVTRTKLLEIRRATGQNPPQPHRDYARLRQLDTLLLAAESSCHDLGAEFVVYGQYLPDASDETGALEIQAEVDR